MSSNDRDVFFKTAQDVVKERLNKPFRHGTSAFRLGLIPQAVSDHLMIKANVGSQTGNHNLLSWNLLADEHLYNNFRNITGTEAVENALTARLGENHIYQGQMIHLFSELAQYLYQHKNESNGEIIVTKELLDEFISLEAQPSLRARSKDEKIAKQKQNEVLAARSTLKDILLDETHQNHHEHLQSIEHSLELISHIKEPDGALRWQNRLQTLKDNDALLKEFVSKDIIMLQECTKPSDIEALLANTGKNIHIIHHNVAKTPEKKAASTDNVVIAFDSDKYLLVDEPLRVDFEGKKPALYAMLQDKQTEEIFIVGSIHHPGGNHDLRDEIEQHINQLQDSEQTRSYFIAGDYNHTQSQWPDRSSNSELFYPDSGTMAGSDFNNLNQSIDAIMAKNDASMEVSVSDNLQAAPPSERLFKLRFEFDKLQNKTALTEKRRQTQSPSSIVASEQFLAQKKQWQLFKEETKQKLSASVADNSLGPRETIASAFNS